jgi:hypothetical protein
MSWIFWILGSLLGIFLLKVLFKAMKIALLLFMVSLVVLLVWLWQQGMILK